MTIHPEGVEFLKYFGCAALVMAYVAFRFSDLPGELFAALIQLAVGDFEPPSTQPTGIPDKRLLSKQSRPVREQIRRSFRETNRRMRREQSRKRVAAFDWFAGIIVAYLLMDWLVIPEAFRISREQRWPIALTVFLAGTLVIFVGTTVWDERIGWKKWTFWISVFTTAICMLGLTRAMPPNGPGFMLLDLLVGGLFFLWVFGRLRRIDRYQLEKARMGALGGELTRNDAERNQA